MKKVSVAFILLSSGLIMYSCGGGDTKSESTTSDTTTVPGNMTTMDTAANADHMADSSTATMSSQPADKDAADFVMKAASGGMMEVEMGNVAQEKAKNQRVKDFGNMIVTDHTNANNELKSLASAKNITLAASIMPDHQKHIDMLKAKSGADFDKAYTKMMVDDHKKDIAEFKKASEHCTDADIKSFATKTLPVLQKHLDSIQAISKSKM